MKLSAIHRFSSTAEAVEDATALSEGKLSKTLKKFLTEEIVDQEGSKKGKGKNEQLVVVDPKLGGCLAQTPVLRPRGRWLSTLEHGPL